MSSNTSKFGSHSVVTARGLAKNYLIYSKPIDRLKQALARGRRTYYQEYQALKPIDLDISAGETIGIVGRNGSGKSTLLQLIVGTLTPTNGTVSTHGRVAALLELGAGFNGEFSGRENVHLYAALMGLSQQEIKDRLDSIISFADIGEFIDRPVRTYSSGMYVRLAFAVAVSVDPDLLIVDEALSVGDEAFQRKCFSRIEQLQKQGTTILFVSHSASSIVQLCNRALLLDKGELLLDGAPRTVVVQYHKLLYGPAEKAEATRAEIRTLNSAHSAPSPLSDTGSSESERHDKPAALELKTSDRAYYNPGMKSQSLISYGNGDAVIEDPHIETPSGDRVNVLWHGDEYVFTYRVRFLSDAFSVRFGMFLRTTTGLDLGGCASHLPEDFIEYVEAGRVAVLRYRFRCLVLTGTYFLNSGVSGLIDGERQSLHRLVDAVMLQVQPRQDLVAAGIVNLEVRPNLKFEASVVAAASSPVAE